MRPGITSQTRCWLRTKERLEALEEQRKELQARIAEERLAKPKMKEEFVRFNRKGRFGILF